MEIPTENRTQASESRKQQGHHLQGKPYIFILRLYFIFKCVHKHAEVTTHVNSATWKLQCRMKGVGMELLSSWPSAQAQLTPKCILRKLVRLLWWQTRTPVSGTPSVARNLSKMTVMGMKLPLIH